MVRTRHWHTMVGGMGKFVCHDDSCKVGHMEPKSHPWDQKPEPKKPRGFWCEFNDKGQCLDLVEGTRDEPPPDPDYVWIQEGVEDLEIYKRAFEAMAKQMIHPKMTGLEMAKMALGEK